VKSVFVQYKFDIKNASFREVPFVIDTMKSVQDGVEDLSIDCMKKASLFQGDSAARPWQ